MTTLRERDRELTGVYNAELLARSKVGDPDHTYVSDCTVAARRAVYDLGHARGYAKSEAERAELQRRLEAAESNYRFMVERAADQKLDGYRELGQRAADAERERDAALDELRQLKVAVAELCAKVGQ